MKLFCTNCGSSFDAANSTSITIGKLGKEYVCPVCEFYPVWANEQREPDPTAISDFEQSIRHLLIQAITSGLQINDIINVLKSELEFAAETGSTGHTFLVQLIDLGSHENSKGLPLFLKAGN